MLEDAGVLEKRVENQERRKDRKGRKETKEQKAELSKQDEKTSKKWLKWKKEDWILSKKETKKQTKKRRQQKKQRGRQERKGPKQTFWFWCFVDRFATIRRHRMAAPAASGFHFLISFI